MIPRRKTLHIELMTGDDLMEGPGATACDVLVLVNLLASVRGERRPALAWQWTRPDGRALRRSGSPGRRVAVPDIGVVPGWTARDGPHLNRLVRRDRSACERLRAVHAAGGHVLAVYNGVALVAEAGLLHGREAVVHWPFIPRSVGGRNPCPRWVRIGAQARRSAQPGLYARAIDATTRGSQTGPNP